MSFDAALLADVVDLSAVTTGTGAGVQVNGGKLLKAFFQANGTTISAGGVTIEEAISTEFVGTWSPIGAEQTLTTATTNVLVFQGPFKALRARVTTAVTGTGSPSVTVRLVIV